MKSSINETISKTVNKNSISFTLLVHTSLSKLIKSISNPELFTYWLCDKVLLDKINSNYIILGDSIIGNWNNSSLRFIKTKHNLDVEWEWILPNVGTSKVTFNIQENQNEIYLKVTHSANFLFSPVNFAEDWLISLSNLKFWLEGEKSYPKLNYRDRDSENLLVSIFIRSNAKKIYSLLISEDNLNKIIANYAEVDIKNYKYSYGWIGDGPLNLLWHDFQKVIVHDWFHDTKPAGIIHWYISTDMSNDQRCELTIKHAQLDLQEEFNKQNVIKTYRHGWIRLLQKMKMLAEYGNISVTQFDII